MKREEVLKMVNQLKTKKAHDVRIFSVEQLCNLPKEKKKELLEMADFVVFCGDFVKKEE